MGSEQIRGGKYESKKMDGGETSTFGRGGSKIWQEEGTDNRDPLVSVGGIQGGGREEGKVKITGSNTASQKTAVGPSRERSGDSRDNG